VSTEPSARPAAPESTTVGLDANVAAMLAYLGWWVTGVLFLILEEESRYVRFHAMQAVVAFGGLSAIGVFLILASFVMLFVSSAGFQVLMGVSELVLLGGFLVWLICMVKAYNGERWKMPIAGPIAERIAGK
jgi:uncharacterized membrane protein